MAELKLSQKVKRSKSFKSFITRLILFSFIHQNLAFATNSLIELDFKDSQTPQRLHVMPRLSNVGDISHIEIDTEQQQVAVYRQGKQKDKDKDKVDDLQAVLPPSENVPRANSPVIIPKHDVLNLPWDLEPEKLTLFILNHTAWLSPLDEDGYKLAFRGGLLGGMKKFGNSYKGVTSDGKGGYELNVPVTKNVGLSGGGGSSQGTNSGWQSVLGKPWAKIEENHKQAVDRMQKQQEALKTLSSVGQPVEIYKRQEIIPHNPFSRIQPPQPSLPFPEDWDSKVDRIDRGMTLLSWCEMYYLAREIGVPDDVIEDWKNHRTSNKVKLSDYLETKKKIEFEKAKKAEEAEKKKLQAIKEEQLKKLNQEKHNALVNSLSQKVMRQGRGFAEIKSPFQQTAEGSIYKGSRYNVEFPLSPLELEACQGKTVCLLSHLKTDTPDVCRVQVVAFKGNVVVGNACSDALPSGKWGYLFTALHFAFGDYDSVWVRPLRTGGTQDSVTSAWSYSTWITDIPIRKEETSHVKVVQNNQNTISFAFPDSPLVYPYFSKDRTTAASFLPSGVTLSSSAITTSKWAKYNFVCPGNIPDSHHHIVESTVYVINHALHEIMQDCSNGDEWDKEEAVSLIRTMTGQHLKRTNSESLENVSKVKGINYMTDYMLPSVIRYNLNEMQKKHEDNEPFDDQVVQDWAKTDWTGLVKEVGKMQKTDPMAPHDYFDLEGKMGGSGLMAGGAGGGKLGWNRLMGKYNKSPGLPTSNDGFVVTKNWDGKLVKNPNGKGYGYPDKDGNVWVPTGVGGSQPGTTGIAHGGAHWDVQMQNGKHQNIYPGGKIR